MLINQQYIIECLKIEENDLLCDGYTFLIQ